MVYSEPGQRESAKNIHLNVSVRAGVIGAVFWELQLAKCPTVDVERERWCCIPEGRGWVLEERL